MSSALNYIKCSIAEHNTSLDKFYQVSSIIIFLNKLNVLHTSSVVKL